MKAKLLLEIKLVRSPIGYRRDQKETVRALGLTRFNKVVQRPDNPTIRGMVAKVSHLLKVEEIAVE